MQMRVKHIIKIIDFNSCASFELRDKLLNQLAQGVFLLHQVGSVFFVDLVQVWF